VYASDSGDASLTLASGTLRARALRLQMTGTGRPSASFVASTAAWIGYIRTLGWPGQDPGQHGPEHQPRGTDRQLCPAHHGRAAKRALRCSQRPIGAVVQWVLSPDTGLRQESDARNPRTCPRGRAEPIAPPPAAKPDEPGNQDWNRQSQQCDNRQHYGDLDCLRICAPPLNPEVLGSRGPRLGGDVKHVASEGSSCRHPQHRQQPGPAADAQAPGDQRPRVADGRPSPASWAGLQQGVEHFLAPSAPVPGGVGEQEPAAAPLQGTHAGLAFRAGAPAFRPRPRSVTRRAASAIRVASARSAPAPGGVSP
jgi:hypothetical protein